MKSRFRFATLAGVLVLGLAASGVVLANGMEFFDAEQDGEILLYYFGNVRDSKGQVVSDFQVIVTPKNVENFRVRFRNDSPGHFRSPDVGKGIKSLGKPVDPRFIEVTIVKDGYKVTKAPKVPDKQGAVELDTFVIDPIK
jgi:hypothetical protein